MAETRVGKKIKKLTAEGKPQKQAVAIALNMDRAGRLTEGGGYKRVTPKKHTVHHAHVPWLHGD